MGSPRNEGRDHRQFVHPTNKGRVTIAGHERDDVPRGTLNSRLKQAGQDNHMRYSVIYEKSRTGWGAYLPDLPGCVATGRTLPVVKRRIREAVALHIQGMREDGERIPRPTTQVEQVEVDAA